MRTSASQRDLLLRIASEMNASVQRLPPGSILQARQSSHEIIFVLDGYCRVLDPQRELGTHTIVRTKGPYLCGTLSLIDPSLDEEVIASTTCEVINFGQVPLPAELETLSNLLLQHNVSASELPILKRICEKGDLGFTPSVFNADIFMRHMQILSHIQAFSSRKPFHRIIYADRPREGFRYGQLLTPDIVNRTWSNSDLPRLIYWGDGDSERYSTDEHIDVPMRRVSEPLSDYGPTEVNQPASEIRDESLLRDDLFSPRSNKSLKPIRELRSLGYRPVSGQSPEKRYEAVLEMLRQYFNLPLRRDQLKKAAQYLSQYGGNGLAEQFINVLDQIGLIGRVVRFSIKDIGRLPTPAILIDEEKNPHLVVEASNNSALCFDPAHGVKRRSAQEIRAFLGDSLNAIVVSAGASTPSKRFGLGWMLPYLKRYRLGLAEVFIASLITQLFALATPMLFQQIIDRVIGQGATEALTGFAVLMVIFMLLELIFGTLRNFQFVEISNRVDISIGSSIISRLLRLNTRYFESRPVGELSSRLNELEKIRSFLTGTALTVVLDSLFALLYFGVMFFYSPILSFIVLASIPLLLIVTLGFTPITQRLIRDRAEAYSKTQSYMVEVLNGIQTIKLQNSELTARRRWEDKHLDGINKGFRAVIVNTFSSNALQLINKTLNILIITVGAWLVINNKLSLGALIAFRIISGYVTQPILRLASTWNSFQEVSLAVERLGDVVNQPLEVGDLETNNIAIPFIKGNVQLDQVSFSYSPTVRPQLSGVSLEISEGSFVGFVGQSGCGKSTLLKLVPRLYEPSSGKVLIDGLDVSKVELYSLRKQLGFVPQDCLLFEGSIFSNIAIADPDADTDRIVEAARLACAHEFIMTLPYGYSTPVGEKGSGLSGGQRQRIALARMLLQKPNLIVLDEATSALDVDTEQQVVTNIRQHTIGKTILMITHRLSTLVNADQIIVMHEGRIDSIGTHDELMSKAGRYYALYQQQLGG